MELSSADLWLADTSSIEENCVPFLLSFLGSGEAARYANFLRQERSRQFLMGRILLRIAVADAAGIDPREIDVTEQAGAAPRLAFPRDASKIVCRKPFFSLSHSGRWVACAISLNAPIGLDVETIRERNRFQEIARMAFHKHECAWLEAQPEAIRQAAFYRIWTRREALFKLLSSLGIKDMPASIHTLPVASVQDSSRQHYCNMTHEDLSIAVCRREPLHKVNLRFLERQNLSLPIADA